MNRNGPHTLLIVVKTLGNLIKVSWLIDWFVEVETSASDHNLEEMMAILTFGGRCEVIQHFTNDYMPIKDALQGINLHNSMK